MKKHLRICVDAGHGGQDPGAVGPKVKEKEANLSVAVVLRELLWKMGHEVTMTRNGDDNVGLMERANIANNSGVDLFISIHHNAGGGDGWEAIHSVFHGVGKELAECIGAEFDKSQNRHGVNPIFDRQGTHGGDYHTVIAKTNMPAIIVEYAFVDSKDAEAIDTAEELRAEAAAIAAGIKAFQAKKLAEDEAQAVKDRNPYAKPAPAAPAPAPAAASESAPPADLPKMPKPEEAEAMSSVPDEADESGPEPAKAAAAPSPGKRGRPRRR